MRSTVLIGLMMATLALVGCGKAKAEAQQGVSEVEAACKEDKDEAVKLGQQWYGKNEVFKKAVDAASKTWEVKDVSKFNYCGVMFKEVKTRIDTN